MSALREPPETIETPAALVDLARVRRNAERAVAHLADHDLGWRPHVKTHKCVRIARIQLDAGARGLTVATPREAEVMSRVTDDLLLAYPPVGRARLARLVDLPPAVDLKVALDSRAALDGLAQAGADAGRRFGVLVEVFKVYRDDVRARYPGVERNYTDWRRRLLAAVRGPDNSVCVVDTSDAIAVDHSYLERQGAVRFHLLALPGSEATTRGSR